jgi:hypothetical protein
MELFFLSQELQAMLKMCKADVSKNFHSVLLHLLEKGDITPGEYEWATNKVTMGIHIKN